MKSLRVLLVDDHQLFREAVRALFATLPGIEIVGEAGDGGEALRAVSLCNPDVVLMDLKMPGMDGVEATRQLNRTRPKLPVVALTTFDGDELVLAALAAGARGYLVKDIAASRIAEALIEVVSGRAVLAPAVTGKVLDEITRAARLAPRMQEHDLTKREQEVLRLLCQGASNKAIGTALNIALGTVKNHLANIYEKLGVKDRTQAALRGRDLGI